MYELKDNFLDSQFFDPIKNFLLGPWMAWYQQDTVADLQEKNYLDGYFIHTFFLNIPNFTRGPRNEQYELFTPLIEKMKVNSLIRLRANNYTRTENIVQHPFHVDYNFPHQTAIFGINTNNGFTIVEKNKKIKSQENRMILLDGETRHCSTTCTDVRSRVNVIINYV